MTSTQYHFRNRETGDREGTAFSVPHSHLLPTARSELGRWEPTLHTFPPRWERQAWAGGAVISQPFATSARNICCHCHIRLGHQHPPAEDKPFVHQPPSATGSEQEVGRGAPLCSWSNFTRWFLSINKLVTFALRGF